MLSVFPLIKIRDFIGVNQLSYHGQSTVKMSVKPLGTVTFSHIQNFWR